MPNISVPLQNTYDSITRPVAVKLAKEIAVITGIGEEGVDIHVPGERGVVSQPGTNRGEADRVKFGSSEKVVCEVTEQPRNSLLMATQVRVNNDSSPVVYDKALGFCVRPVYVQHDLVFQFKYSAPSAHAARRWADGISTAFAENRVGMQHTVNYNLTFNDDILALAWEIFQKRERLSPYNDQFRDWFESIQLKPVHVKGTIDGSSNNLLLQVEEHQAHLVGYFDGVTEAKEQRNDDNVTYDIEFTYKVSYQKAIRWNVVYPILVHQTHLDTSYIDMEPYVSIDDLDTTGSRAGWSAFERIVWNQRGRSKQPVGGLRFPYYDDWFVPNGPIPWTLPAITWLISLEELKPQDVLDLNDLPDMKLSPNFRRYLLEQRVDVTRPGKALVLFTLYDGDQPLDESLLTLGEDLVIRTTRPLSFRPTYHLRMSVVTSDLAVSTNVLSKASQYPKAVLEIFQTALPNLDVEWAWKNAVDEGVMDVDYMYWVFHVLENRSIGSNGQIPMKRKVFVNPIPEVKVLVERNANTAQVTGPKDPGLYSGTNEPKVEDVAPASNLDFEFETEEDFQERIAKRETPKNSISPNKGEEIPVINNHLGVYTTQYLALFVYKR